MGFSSTLFDFILLCWLAICVGFSYENLKRATHEVNQVVAENLIPGARSWWHSGTDEILQVLNGFTTKFSYNPGEIVEFKVNSSNWERYNISIYRLGYYDGLGARLLQESTIQQLFDQPKCKFSYATRMTDCANWNISFVWTIPKELISSICVAVASHESGGKRYVGNYIPFIIKKQINSNTKAYGSDLLFKTSDTTWVAYNKFGGWNIYRGNGSFTFDSRAYMASYNRPFTNRLPKLMGGQHQNFLFGTEFAALFWLERHGFDVTYASCQDVELYHRHGLLANRYRVLLSVGHDEYWSEELREAYETARENGINLAFWSGNEIFWKIRWQKSISTGNESITDLTDRQIIRRASSSSDNFIARLRSDEINPNRILVCYKETIDNTLRSADPSQWTGTFIDPRFRKPNNIHSLTGQYFEVNGFRHDSIKISSEDSKLRFWRNCPLFNSSFGYALPSGYLGYEWDVFRDDCNLPLGIFPLSTTAIDVSGFKMESFGASYKGGGLGLHRMTMYRHIGHHGDLHHAPKTALVFGAGTIQWVWGLSDFHDYDDYVPADANIQQATLNMLADMNVLPSKLDKNSCSPALKISHSSKDFEPPTSIITYPSSLNTVNVISSRSRILNITGTASDRGGGAIASVQVSIDGGQSWLSATGRDVWYFEVNFGKPRNSCSKLPNFALGNFTVLHIVSRAVDDSGWVEPCNSTLRSHGGSHGTNHGISHGSSHLQRLRGSSHAHNHRYSRGDCTVPSSTNKDGHAPNNIIVHIA